MGFYTNDSVAALATDIMLQCGKLYAKPFRVETTGTMGTPGATAAITLTAGVSVDDLYNGDTLYIVDDNSKLCTVAIDDSIATGGTIIVDTTASLLIEDNTTAGSFTSTVVYNLYILGDEEFVGYSTQSLDYEEETAEFLDCNEKVRDDITKVVLGFSGDCKNFATDKTFANVFGLTEYGSQTGQVEYHGGFSPATKAVWQVTLKATDVNSKQHQIQLFKGSFFSGGAIDFSAAGEYKIVPYSFKAVKDTLRDSSALNGWSVKEAV